MTEKLQEIMIKPFIYCCSCQKQIARCVTFFKVSATSSSDQLSFDTKNSKMTATSAAGFKWLDLLEKEFDKSFVSLDHHSRNVAEEFELEEMYDTHRRLLSNMGNCFVQLVHKSQTIFQVNAKLEAELLNCREELSEAQKVARKAEAEKSYLLCLLTSCLLENSILKSKDPSKVDQEKMTNAVQLRLANDLATFQKIDWNSRSWIDKAQNANRDVFNLKQRVAELESELVGARLDAKYLDKELAGRIQQIQILLASNASQEHKQQVWAQIEAEMHLQRSKTIANMCYSKQRLRDQQVSNVIESKSGETKPATEPHQPSNGHASGAPPTSTPSPATTPTTPSSANAVEFPRKNRMKQVHLHMHDSDELGMAILGGVEHGLPIIISEVFPNSAVGRSKKIYAGDIILGVNGDSFTEMGHHEAVKYLSGIRGSIRFDLENTIEADIDEVCDMDMRFYQLHVDDQESNKGDQAKVVPSKRLNYPGKAKDVRNKTSCSSTTSTTSSKASTTSSAPATTTRSKELPQVHSSPSRNCDKVSSNSSAVKNDEDVVVINHDGNGSVTNV